MNTQLTHSLADYHSLKLSVRSTGATSLSCTIACYCVTPGVPKSIEPYPVRVAVNFYKFKAYMIEVKKVADFNLWLAANKDKAGTYIALSEYVNQLQGRTMVYMPKSETSKQLDTLIAQAKNVTAIYHSIH